MEVTAELTRYSIWGFVVVIGVALAVADWRLIRRPIFGALLLLLVAAGSAVTVFSPFNFADGGYYMVGVLLAGAAALAFGGYLLGSLIFLLVRLVRLKG